MRVICGKWLTFTVKIKKYDISENQPQINPKNLIVV